MKDMQREILNQVATGQISASEGAARIEALGTEPGVAPVQVAAPTQAADTPRSVRVVSNLGSTTIVGDPTVATAIAEGPHNARIEGDLLVIDFGFLSEDETFAFGPASRWINGLGRSREGLIVRMNPELPLTARLRAGNVKVLGVHGPINVEVQAGDCQIEDFQDELNALVQAGSFSAGGRLDRGSSRIRCQMGEVKLNLQNGSSVRISAHSTLGDVSIDGASLKRGEAPSHVQIGTGAGSLHLECTMGDIRVNAE